jgi:hypothetical protein
MRVILILVGMICFSSAMYAQQQQRQMQKADAVVQSKVANNAVPLTTPPAPRQMAPIGGNKPVPATSKASGTNAPAAGQKREMIPLNPDKAEPKKN